MSVTSPPSVARASTAAPSRWAAIGVAGAQGGRAPRMALHPQLRNAAPLPPPTPAGTGTPQSCRARGRAGNQSARACSAALLAAQAAAAAGCRLVGGQVAGARTGLATKPQHPPARPAPQVQSNALAALEAIDPSSAHKVMAEGCITGDRINGLCDGVSGDWWVAPPRAGGAPARWLVTSLPASQPAPRSNPGCAPARWTRVALNNCRGGAHGWRLCRPPSPSALYPHTGPLTQPPAAHPPPPRAGM